MRTAKLADFTGGVLQCADCGKFHPGQGPDTDDGAPRIPYVGLRSAETPLQSIHGCSGCWGWLVDGNGVLYETFDHSQPAFDFPAYRPENQMYAFRVHGRQWGYL